MKPFYSEFVRHCLRYYIKTMDEGKGGVPIFKSEADKANWKACYEALKNCSEDEMDTIAYIYRQGDTIPDKIYQLSKDKGVNQDTIWGLINHIERRVAKQRGLV